VIREAPEYGSHIIICFNVSQQEYIGESIISRNQLMESELYVTTYYAGVKENTSSSTMVQNYLVMAVGSVIAAILVFLFVRKRRVSNVERY